MPSVADAVLQDEGGHPVLRFERVLQHPIDRVWTALTQLEDLRAWHPSPFSLEPRAGGRVRYLAPDGHAFGDGRVIHCEPPHLLAYEWGDDRLRWELSVHDDGTRLVLTHSFEDRRKSARDAAGWDLCLDALMALLSGGGGQASAENGSSAEWSERNRHYEERFGIDPADAIPPPNHLAASDAAVPLLMFTGQAEEAMRFYVSVFFPARIEHIERYGAGEDSGIPGTVKHAVLRLGDRTLECIDSPPVHDFTFTPAVSIAVHAESPDAVDGMFARLAEGGTVLMELGRYPFSERFAWVTDRFGVSWQISLG